MAKKKVVKKKKEIVVDSPLNFDLNDDGVFDAKDKSIAGKVLRGNIPIDLVDEKPIKKENLIGGKIAKDDINLTYRKGSFVPQEKIDLWVSMGIDITPFF